MCFAICNCLLNTGCAFMNELIIAFKAVYWMKPADCQHFKQDNPAWIYHIYVEWNSILIEFDGYKQTFYLSSMHIYQLLLCQ